MELKFRGLTKIDKQMIYGSSILQSDDGSIHIFPDDPNELDSPDAYEVIPKTVGQYIGLKDKNGKEIYNGDKLIDQGHNTGVVMWNQDDCSFSVDWDQELESLYKEDSSLFEIIGNIHES